MPCSASLFPRISSACSRRRSRADRSRAAYAPATAVTPLSHSSRSVTRHPEYKRAHRGTPRETSLAEAARKPGSVPAAGLPATGNDHSSRTAVTDGLKQPTRKHGRAVLDASLLGLAPGGVYLASGVAVGPGELLPHPFTLTRLRISSGGRTSLCGTFPGVTPAGRYPAPRPVEPGLSSPCRGRRRPSGLLRPSFVLVRAACCVQRAGIDHFRAQHAVR